MDQDVLVTWPDEEDEDWRDTHQGGLFAYLVYRSLGEVDRAQVDVSAHLYAPRQSLLTALERQLWAAPVAGGPVGEKRSLQPWSGPLRAALYLGSCRRSLIHAATGAPFQVTWDALTRTGKEIKHCLDYEYDFGGDLLTFSGAPQRRLRWRWPLL